MVTESFQCPSCGAPLLPKGNSSVISCPHCLTSVVVPEELRVDTDIEWTTLLYDNFSTNDNNWLTETKTSEYFAPLSQVIADGRYRWEAQVIKVSSISTSWLGAYRVSDFHLIANAKHILGSRANSSWGLIFRIQDNRNYYFFHMTDSQFFAVSATQDGQWHQIVDWTRTDAIKPMGNNQLEIIAQETHFIFLINGQIVSETDDEHYGQGLVGVAIEAYKSGEKVTFDFLDFTLRGRSEKA